MQIFSNVGAKTHQAEAGKTAMSRVGRQKMRQAEAKAVIVENRSGAYFTYVSTGSTEDRRLQPGLTYF